MKVLFFAGLRETMGTDAIEIELETPITIGALKHRLQGPDGTSLAVLSEKTPLLAAVDKEMAADDTLVEEASEVAFFPPVTGG